MKRTASATKRSSGTSTRRNTAATERRFAVCVRNEGYEASLERNKIYAPVPDEVAERDGDPRVIDESGEDFPVFRASFVSGSRNANDDLTTGALYRDRGCAAAI